MVVWKATGMPMRFQLAAQPLAVGIEPLTADELAADRDDFGSHELHALPGHSLQPGGSPILPP